MLNRSWLPVGIIVVALASTGFQRPAFAQVVPHEPGSGHNLPGLNLRNPQNILLIIADDLGIEALERYQTAFGITTATTATTPRIDALAASGVTFLNVWSNPLCTPTRAGIYSGRHVFHHGLGSPKDVNVDDGTESLEASLAASGEAALPAMLPTSYRSGLFGKWHAGGPGTADPSSCPAGGYYDSPRNLGWDTHDGSWQELPGGETYCSWSRVLDGACPVLETTEYATDYVVDHALAWIETVRKSPWFVTVALNAPHEPLHSPAAAPCTDCVAGNERACFIDMVNSVDYAVGTLVDGLQSMRELENTIIIFVGDNGTAQNSATGVDAPYPDKHWKASVYLGGIHVPLIIADGCRLAGHCRSLAGLTRIVSPNRNESALAHTIDLFATIVQIARSTAVYTSRDAISVRPYLVSSTTADLRQYLYTEGDDDETTGEIETCTIRDATYKLIVTPCTESNASGCELYNLDDEPYGAESDDLLAGAIPRVPLELPGILSELQSIRGWAGHPCTDWVVSAAPPKPAF
jgi:arylsulfatase B